jgi:NAD(P)-dependent dehydrogenase (short-subunit alcohol dehydrogenase family)
MDKPVCAVVGVGPGNGQAFAKRFSREGYAIALLSRSTEYSNSIARQLPDTKAYACDAANAADVARAFGSVQSELGPVDTLLYNAGAGIFGTFDEIDEQGFELAWRTNVLGFVNCAKAVYAPMLERGTGSIIVSGATASLRGRPATAAFAAAKAGQRSLAQSLARQLGPSGIHVAVVIIDGVIDLPRTRERFDKPDDFFLNPDDIAATVFHLATQPRSAWSFEVDVRPFGETW